MRRLSLSSSRALTLTLCLPCVLASSTALAGEITAEGQVLALDDMTQVASVVGSAVFDEMTSGDVPLDAYADQGLNLQVGPFTDLLPGVDITGEAAQPIYVSVGDRFPPPIAGGGVATGGIVFYAGALTFNDAVTQFGMTAGGGMTQYITAYDAMGGLIGQVKWVPDEELEDAAFVGIDTMGVPIALLVIGNDDLVAGEEYVVTGSGTANDTWLWGGGAPCAGDEDCLDDMWACTMRACIDGACQYDPTMEPCDDVDMCTEVDTCVDMSCVGTPVNCSDDNVCTFDTCDPETGCSSEPIEECCLSDEDCPEGQTCLLSSNTCQGGPPPPPEDPETEEEEGGEEETESGGEETGAPADEDGAGGCTSSEGSSAPAGLGLLALFGLLGLRRRRQLG